MMWLNFYQNLPSLLNPIAFSIGFFSVRWYSLMYFVGFLIVYFLLWLRIARGEAVQLQKTKKEAMESLFDLMLVFFGGGLLGGRLGFVLFYEPAYFLTYPLRIFSPFDAMTGNFVGLYGMSFFGALGGSLLGGYFFAKKSQLDFLAWADFFAPAIPAGYFFGRLGNFLNGELLGKVTTSNFGMHFPGNTQFLHLPSQLLEAFLEGLVLFVVLWSLRNAQQFQKGFFLQIYLFGYALTRFICEFFRQSDSEISLISWDLTLGQVFSLLVMFFLILQLFLKKQKSAILKK